MPESEIPEWFDFKVNEEVPYFWARGNFPVVALAFFFSNKEGAARPGYSWNNCVWLELFINGQRVPHIGFYNCEMDACHVLVCDLRAFFSEKAWLDLDTFLVYDWNLVQVSYKVPHTNTMILSSWGVYVYKQETNMKDVRFRCPSQDIIANTSSPPPTAVAPSSDDDDDPNLLQALVMKKDENCESEAKSKMCWKLIEEHKALRNKLENQSNAAPDELDSWKHQLLVQLNSTSQPSDSQSAFSGTEMQRDCGKEGRKKHEKLAAAAAVSKGRGEELQGLFDAEIEGFQKSHESHHLTSVVYLQGVRDGVLEALATLLALDMDRVTTQEHVTEGDDDDDHIEEHDVTHEDADESKILNQTTSSPSGYTSYVSRRRRVFRRFLFKQ